MTDAELVEAVRKKWPGSKFAENLTNDLLNGVNYKVCRAVLEAACKTIYKGVTKMEQSKIRNSFTYHAPKDDQPARYASLRDDAYVLAESINNLCPDSREKSIAITKLEEAVMWANKSIACNE